MSAESNSSSPSTLDYRQPQRGRPWSRWQFALTGFLVCFLVGGVALYVRHPGSRASGPLTASVQIIVTDAATAQPVQGARISLFTVLEKPDATALTDASGTATVRAQFGHSWQESPGYDEEKIGSGQYVRYQHDGYVTGLTTLPRYAHYTRILFWHLTPPPFAPTLHIALIRKPATQPTTKPNQ